MNHQKFISIIATLLFAVMATGVSAYPLDGFDETDITRLEGYFYSLKTPSGRDTLPVGALLSLNELSLHPEHPENFTTDSGLARDLSLLKKQLGHAISISIIDLHNPGTASYAGQNDTTTFIPGSLGKVLVAMCFFDALKQRFPDDVAARENLLRTKKITANEFIKSDSHVVPFWDHEARKIYHRPLQIGDTANLWSYLDWMISASSNAAGSMIMREVLLMNHFGKAYPVSRTEEDAFFRKASPGTLGNLMRRSFFDPIKRAGFSPTTFRQASFFTGEARRRVAGQGSVATTRDFARLMYMIDRGKLLDEFSSKELKRLFYMTQGRARYAAASALDTAALFFKSASLYRCRPEAGFACDRFKGNLTNMMNAVVIVEDPVATTDHHYIVALSTNILKQDSAAIHTRLGSDIHRMMIRRSGNSLSSNQVSELMNWSRVPVLQASENR